MLRLPCSLAIQSSPSRTLSTKWLNNNTTSHGGGAHPARAQTPRKSVLAPSHLPIAKTHTIKCLCCLDCPTRFENPMESAGQCESGQMKSPWPSSMLDQILFLLNTPPPSLAVLKVHPEEGKRSDVTSRNFILFLTEVERCYNGFIPLFLSAPENPWIFPLLHNP